MPGSGKIFLFSVHKAYKRFRERHGTEDEKTTRACQVIWKQKVQLKVRIFGWLLLRRRLTTRVFWKKMYPDASDEFILCREGAEDCKHLFFHSPFACTIWDTQGAEPVEAIHEISFWALLQRGGYRRKKEGGQILSILWAIWLHWNEVMLRGKPASTDSVLHGVEGLMGFWFP